MYEQTQTREAPRAPFAASDFVNALQVLRSRILVRTVWF